MESPWQVPLPLGEKTRSQVLVYFHDGKWVPTICCPLVDAIELHRKGLIAGSEFFVFPPDLNLANSPIPLDTEVEDTSQIRTSIPSVNSLSEDGN